MLLLFQKSDDHGFSLLHCACWEGRLNICEMLLNRGAKVNLINKCQDTPLHCAVQNNHIEVVYLVRYKFLFFCFLNFKIIIIIIIIVANQK